jgi:hypothetical protein
VREAGGEWAASGRLRAVVQSAKLKDWRVLRFNDVFQGDSESNGQKLQRRSPALHAFLSCVRVEKVVQHELFVDDKKLD